jgi:hypothetical protein
VRDPDGFGHEEAFEVGRLAHERAAVGGEGEDAVEAVLDRGAAQRRQQVLAVLPRGQEVFQREVQAGGHAVVRHFLCGNLWQGGHVHGHGTVGVAADTDAVAVHSR